MKRLFSLRRWSPFLYTLLLYLSLALGCSESNEGVPSNESGTATDTATDTATSTDTAPSADTTEPSPEDTQVPVDTQVADCDNAAACDDQNTCTEEACTEGLCVHTPLSGSSCDDGNACTDNDACTEEGTCNGSVAELVPPDPCSTCSCDPQSGVTCSPVSEGTSCANADCCTMASVCTACAAGEDNCSEAGLACRGEAVPCDDEDDCTANVCSCDEDNNATCSHPSAEDGSPCDDNPNDCTLGDTCLAGQCIVADPLPLDDNNPCTEDACVKGEIVHNALLAGQCEDGNECTQDDSCYLGNCVGGGLVVCTKSLCASSVSCVPGEGCVNEWMPTGASCDDGNECSQGDSCTAEHQCMGDGILCDDGKPCTLDVCQDETCVHLPGELDGTVCKPNSACAADGVCVGDTCESTADITCNDNNICTDDSCDDATGCIYTPNTASCDDEDDCTEEDLCASSTCTGTPIDDCAPNEGTTTLWADADTWLEGTSNVGTHKYLIIGKHGGYPIKRSLLRFDTSSLPTGTALQSAELRIYYNYAHASSFNPEEAIDRVIAVHRMLVPWTETGANKNTSDGNSPWNAPLVGLDEVDAEATPAATELWIAADTKQFNSFDITALAQQWIDAPESNFGALLMAQNEAEEGRDMRCFSRNYGDDEALRPHLVLVY